MSEDIHGHEVMEMILSSGGTYTVESLEAAIHAKFGKEVRFYTCSASNMTARELICFLDERGKFTVREGGFTTDPEKICNHDDEHENP